jgi:hypothetical protein
MTTTKKTIIALFCAAILTTTTSCSQRSKTGCPTWGKVKAEQTNKKNV